MSEGLITDGLAWEGALLAVADTKTPPDYTLMQLRREGVPELAKALGDWYPDLRVSGEQCHLDPEFYYQHCALAGETSERPVLAIVATNRGAVVGVLTLERDVPSLTVSCRVGAIAPDHRGPALALLGPQLLERVGRRMGAALVLYYATLQTPHQQLLAERCRFVLVGIVPACDQNYASGHAVKRVYEAIYAKVLCDDASVALPPEGALTLKTRAVWRALFPGQS